VTIGLHPADVSAARMAELRKVFIQPAEQAALFERYHEGNDP
jgi:hypothetical protein